MKPLGWRLGVTRHRCKAHRERELTALSNRAVKAHFATHGFHQARGDGKTKAGTAKFPSRGRVCLRKGFEDLLMLFRRNAYARVLHGETNGNFTYRRIQPKSLYGDMSFVCKFDCVPGEINKALAHPGGGAAKG